MEKKSSRIKELVLNARNMTKFGLFNFYKSKEERYDDAIELYKQACDEYKKERLFRREYETYLEIINLIIDLNKTTFEKKQYEKTKNNNRDLCEYYEKAILAYKNTKHIDNDTLVDLMRAAIKIHVDLNKYRSANKYLETIAKIKKGEEKHNAAIDAYKLAKEYSDIEDDIYSSLRYSSEIKNILIEEKKYVNALTHLEDILEGQKINEEKFKFEITNTLFDLILCKFIINVQQGVKYDLINDIETYDKIYHYFETSQKRILAYKTIKSYEENNMEEFVKALREYDRFVPLSKIQIDIYSDIKKALKEKSDTTCDGRHKEGVDEYTYEVDFT